MEQWQGEEHAPANAFTILRTVPILRPIAVSSSLDAILNVATSSMSLSKSICLAPDASTLIKNSSSDSANVSAEEAGPKATPAVADVGGAVSTGTSAILTRFAACLMPVGV